VTDELDTLAAAAADFEAYADLDFVDPPVSRRSSTGFKAC